MDWIRGTAQAAINRMGVDGCSALGPLCKNHTGKDTALQGIPQSLAIAQLLEQAFCHYTGPPPPKVVHPLPSSLVALPSHFWGQMHGFVSTVSVELWLCWRCWGPREASASEEGTLLHTPTKAPAGQERGRLTSGAGFPTAP